MTATERGENAEAARCLCAREKVGVRVNMVERIDNVFS